MMKFKRWKKMIVMLLIATMFLQSVVVYADDTEPKTKAEEEQNNNVESNDKSTTPQTPSDGSGDANNPADPSGKGDADNLADPSGKGNAETPADSGGKGDAKTPADSDGKGDAKTPADSDGKSDVGDPKETTGAVNSDGNGINADEGAEEETQETEPVNKEVPEEVKAFLEAVAKLPDSITTAEEYDAVEAAMENLSAQYDALSDEAKNGDSVKNAKAKLDKLQEQLKNGRPEEEEEVPAEVKAFLDAVAALPSADEVTPENAEEIGEQVNAVLNMWDAMSVENGEREDVQSALNDTVYPLYAAVEEALELWKSTFDASGDSLFGRDYHIYYNNIVDELNGKTLNLNIKVGVGETWVDEGVFRFWDKSYGVYNVSSWDDFDIWSTNERVLKVTAVPNGKSLKIIYEGIADGTAQIKMAFNLTTVSTGEGSVWGSGNWGAAACANCTVGTATVGAGGGTVEPDKPTTMPDPSNIYVKMFCDGYTNPYYNTHFGNAGYLSNHTDKWSLGEIVPCDWMDGYDWFCPLNMDMNKWTSFYNRNYGTHMFSMFGHSTSKNDREGALNNPIPTNELGFYWDSENQDWAFYSGYLYIAMTEYRTPIDYTVKHEYYTDGKFDGSTSETRTGDKTGAKTGTKIYPSGLIKKTVYKNNQYTYKSGTPNPLVCCDDVTANVITLRYERATYTVTYTDGVQDETVFADQGTEGLKAGDVTPAFNAATFGTETVNGVVQPKRTGYTFQGWSPAVKATVDPAMANANGEIIYTATWQKNPELKPLTVSKTPSEEYPVVGTQFYYTIVVNNPNSTEIKVNITDELNGKLDFVFVGDGGTYDKTTRTVTWTNVTVPANGSKTVTVYVKANAAGSIYNEAGVAWTGGSTSGNTTVTAKPSSYKLTYDANGGTIRASGTTTTMTDESNYSAGGHTFTVKTAPEASTGFNPTWAGHTLLGWADTENATTVQYRAGDTITVTEAAPTKTIYAVWQTNPEKHTVTVKYMCDKNGKPFSEGNYSYSLAEGEDYDHSVDAGKTGYPQVKDFKKDYRSPKSFKIGSTWAYDEVRTTDALTGTMGDQDIEIKVWYSMDDKGIITQDGTDTPDGIPDKYQVKIVYDADGKGTIEGKTVKTEYKTIEKDGRMATSGNVIISGATVDANGGQYCTGWTASSTDSGWKHDDVSGSKVPSKKISVKGKAVYTFTAQYIKAPTREEIPGILDPDGSGSFEFVIVDCVNTTINPLHDNSTYGLLVDGGDVTVSEITKTGDEYFCKVIVTADGYVNQYNKDIKEAHTLVDSSKGTAELTLKWDGSDWIPADGNANTVTFRVRCGKPSANVTVTRNYSYTLKDETETNKEKTESVTIPREILSDAVTVNAGDYTRYDISDEIGTKEYELEVSSVTVKKGNEKITYNLDDLSLTFAAEKDNSYEVILNYKLIEKADKAVKVVFENENGEKLGETPDKESPVKYGDTYDVTEEVKGNYSKDGKDYYQDENGNYYIILKVDEKGDPVTGTADSDKVVKVICTLDNIGPDDEPDGIPDKYQVVVTYRAVNGTINGPVKAVVTLTNEAGDYATAEDGGKGNLTAEQIPGTSANEGYENGTWAPATPTVTYEITEDTEFVITYSQNTTTPGGGDDPTPTPPGGGGGGTGGGGGGGTPDPTPTPPIPEITPLIPEIVPAVGPTTAVVPTVTPVPATPVAPTPTAALVSPTPEAVALADEAIPLAAGEEKEQPEPPIAVDEEKTPLAGGKGAAWALINFALMNLAIFESVMLLIGYFVKTKNDEEEEKRKLKKKGIFRVISLPIAIISLIVFILTEDITLPTAFVDKYTIVMLIIAIVQTVMVALSNKKYEDEEEV